MNINTLWSITYSSTMKNTWLCIALNIIRTLNTNNNYFKGKIYPKVINFDIHWVIQLRLRKWIRLALVSSFSLNVCSRCWSTHDPLCTSSTSRDWGGGSSSRGSRDAGPQSGHSPLSGSSKAWWSRGSTLRTEKGMPKPLKLKEPFACYFYYYMQ